jgi:hypothetical protein
VTPLKPVADPVLMAKWDTLKSRPDHGMGPVLGRGRKDP